MNNVLRNKLKNIRILRELYRTYSQKEQKNKLLSEVHELKSIKENDFNALKSDLFKSITIENTGENRLLTSDPGFKVYFKTEVVDNKIHISDHFKGAPYFSRQRMLATAYHYIGLDKIKNFTLTDLAGSCGYYSFLAFPYGFKEITVLEGRKEYKEQYQLLQDKIPAINVVWEQKDVTKGIDSYDVVLCQGLLYHLYDHLEFLSMLYRKANHYLVLETELSGHSGFLNLSKFEDVSDNRQGLAGIALYPSYLTVISLLKTAGFKKITRVAPPTGIDDLHGYNKNRRTMLVCEK